MFEWSRFGILNMNRILDQFPLRRGAHDRRDDGMCAMEMVAWLAGEDHSDEPRCACPAISSYVRALNDLLPDDSERTRLLRPLVPKFVNTRGNDADALLRGWVVLDGTMRELLPHVMRSLRRGHEAEAFASSAPIVDVQSAQNALALVDRLAPDQHSMRWMLQRAIEGCRPAQWVPGAMQLVRRANDTAAFELAALVAARMSAGVSVRKNASARR